MSRFPITIQHVTVTPVSFRLRAPFITAAGEKTETHNVQVDLRLSNNVRSRAEASSSIALSSESQSNLMHALKELIPEVRGQRIDHYKEIITRCWRAQPYHPTATAAMECAVLDAYTQHVGRPLYSFLGGKSQKVETDLTFSVAPPEQLAQQAKAALQRGFRRFKIKLSGDSLELDWNRLEAVHRAAPSALIVADGNQGFRLTQAVELSKRMERGHFPIVFFEQPFRKHDMPAMRQFRSRCKTPLFADESVMTPADAMRLFEAGAADGVNVKVAKSGLLGSLDIIRIAQRFKKRLAIGCMEESKVGLAASVHLACGSGAFEWVDLDSIFLLETSRLKGGFSVKGASLSVSSKISGTGL